MLRKTQRSRMAPSRHGSQAHFWKVQDAPRVDWPLALICGACGAIGRYKVGTVTCDPKFARSPDAEDFEKSIGFTGYFRCRRCDAGGPWTLSNQAFLGLAALLIAKLSGDEDAPLIFGCTATFDGHVYRYATDSEAHLQALIDEEPDNAFLWVRLGNLYGNAGCPDRAEPMYERALELDPADIEAHCMLAQVLLDADRPLDAVPHLHAVLKYARRAVDVPKELRRHIVRGTIERLLRLHVQFDGEFELLPTVQPEEIAETTKDEPIILELREFDMGSDRDIDDLCDMFLGEPRSFVRDLFRTRKRSAPVAIKPPWVAPAARRTAAVARNAPCPCGSGHKYKKCCGRAAVSRSVL